MPPIAVLRSLAISQIAAIERDYTRLRNKQRYLDLGGRIEPDEYAEFSAKCLGLIDRLLGRRDAYYVQVLQELERHEMTSETLASTLHGIVRSLKNDIQDETFASFREWERAELYEVSLRQAEQLLGRNHKDAAAIIVGAMLVVHLEQLAKRYDLIPAEDDTNRPPNPAWLNGALAGSVYGALEQQNVSTWLALWEQATHGRYNKYGHTHVTVALHEVREFLTQFPA
jgi:hypothetical protein